MYTWCLNYWNVITSYNGTWFILLSLKVGMTRCSLHYEIIYKLLVYIVSQVTSYHNMVVLKNANNVDLKYLQNNSQRMKWKENIVSCSTSRWQRQTPHKMAIQEVIDGNIWLLVPYPNGKPLYEKRKKTICH